MRYELSNKEWSIIRVMLATKPHGAGYTSASGLLTLSAVPGGGINVTFTSVGDIDAWKEGGATHGRYVWKVCSGDAAGEASARSSQANEARIRVSYV